METTNQTNNKTESVTLAEKSAQEKFSEKKISIEIIEKSVSNSKSLSQLRTLLLSLLSVFLIVLVTLLVGKWFIAKQFSPILTSSSITTSVIETTEFEILPGWGATKIANELEKNSLIQNALFFKLLLRYRGSDRSIGKGLYYLSPNMNAFEIAAVLEAGGKPRTVRVVIPEGFRYVDIAKRLQQTEFIKEQEVLALIQKPHNLRPSYIPKNTGLEGYLFPASYEIPLQSTAQEILIQMLKRFEQELSADIKTNLAKLNLTMHEWVTLASVVQAEAGSDAEMAIIAGVFFNRLEHGMPLQSDPTVAYGLNKLMTELDASAGDFSIKADHPWNTYTRTGLPKGPISNPGKAALQAVLDPKRQNEQGQDFFYFLHSPDGKFYPNLNLSDHQRDVRLYLR